MNAAWNTDVEAVTTRSAGRYALEVRIPFADLGGAPAAGEVRRANFYRFLPDCAAWSPTYGGFHSPARFGHIRFAR